MSANFVKINKALAQLKAATSKEPANDLERDGAIQRFEYTIEMLWKLAKVVLAENGVQAIAPKDVIRELANIGWINNPQTFIDYLLMRNESSHSYKEEIAKKVYAAAQNFTSDCEILIDTLKKKST